MSPAIELEGNLHPAQEQVWNSPARFRVVGCGRRFGKTHLAVTEMLYAMLTTPGGEFLWVAPNYETTDIGFEAMAEVLPSDLTLIKRSRPYSIRFAHARLKFMSADKERVGTGWGFNGMVVDEGAFVKDKVWHGALRPTLSDRKGWALLIGTFDGDENYFYEGYERGQDPDEPEYDSWRYPTLANPYIDPEEVESARRTLPKEVFEQEYEANPLSYAGAVFSGELVQSAWDRGQAEVWTPGLTTEAGLDWGYTNPTALEVAQITTDDHVRWLDETLWHSVELNERCHEIALKCQRLRISRIYADAAGKDENVTLAKHLKNLGIKTTIKPVPFNKFKNTGITARRWHLERGRESIGSACRVLFRDTKRYRYKEDAAKEDVVKEDDHTVDATIALYATRFPKAAGRTD